ncbi:MAG: hypothetical protein ACK5CV_04795, partial [Bacteroidota bacterium]
METLRLYFDNFLKLDDFEWADFEKCIVKKQIVKNEQILKQGEYCNFIAFIHEGSFRFYYDKDGEEKITAFNFKG